MLTYVTKPEYVLTLADAWDVTLLDYMLTYVITAIMHGAYQELCSYILC